jgi:hypothetical protein
VTRSKLGGPLGELSRRRFHVDCQVVQERVDPPHRRDPNTGRRNEDFGIDRCRHGDRVPGLDE